MANLVLSFRANYDEPESPMLHTCTKFHGNLSTGSGEEDLFTIYGRGCLLIHVTQMP